MPLPSTRPIPDGWDDHHRPVATAAMTATCVAGTLTPGAYDPVTLQYGAPVLTTKYTGPCRVQQRTGQEQTSTSAGQTITTRSYLVALEHDADTIAVDDVVDITDAVDTGLVGRRLRVLDVSYGSNQWQRDLTCQDFEG